MERYVEQMRLVFQPTSSRGNIRLIRWLRPSIAQGQPQTFALRYNMLEGDENNTANLCFGFLCFCLVHPYGSVSNPAMCTGWSPCRITTTTTGTEIHHSLQYKQPPLLASERNSTPPSSCNHVHIPQHNRQNLTAYDVLCLDILKILWLFVIRVDYL